MIFPLTLLVLVYLFGASVVLAGLRPDFSHMRDTLSELGTPGTRHAGFASWGVFFPLALTLLLIAGLARSTDGALSLLALCLALGYLSAALFPCDPGAPLRGSFRQQLHNLGAAAEYLGGSYALLRLSESHGRACAVAALLILLVALLGMLPALTAVRGALQRGAELLLFTALVLLAPS